MQIEIGKRFINKTWRFLYPCLRGHGDAFVSKINTVWILAMGVNDTTLNGTDYSKERNMFILLDTFYQEKTFNNFMSWIVYQPFYKHHYKINTYDNDVSRKLMLVISVPDCFYHSYDHFINSEYSKMYTVDEAKILFKSTERKKELDIVTKNINLQSDFIKSVNEEFGTDLCSASFDEPIKEYELPLITKEEIFNYHSDNYYLVKELDKV